jgi:hypothetical protein
MGERQLSTRDLADTPGDEERNPEEVSAERMQALDQGGTMPATDGGSADDELPSEPGAESEPEVTGEKEDAREPLLPGDQSDRFTTQWQEIQASFVDRPRESVEQADALVADLMQRLAASFSTERENLEAQWDRGDDVSTEDLRVALTRYRSFFDRLLSA